MISKIIWGVVLVAVQVLIYTGKIRFEDRGIELMAKGFLAAISLAWILIVLGIIK